MGRQVAVVLYVVAMAAVIIGVDFAFLRNRFWERLIVNIGIVGVRSFLLEIPQVFMRSPDHRFPAPWSAEVTRLFHRA